MTPAGAAFEAWLELHADEAGETLWLGALVMLERAAAEAREGKWGRWRFYPRGELRRLRRDVTAALALARLAVAMAEAERAAQESLAEDLQARATAAARGRRAGTLEAERVRLLKARARRERREPTTDELYPWLTEPREVAD